MARVFRILPLPVLQVVVVAATAVAGSVELLVVVDLTIVTMECVRESVYDQ